MEKQIKTQQIKIVPMGNSLGIRLPKAVLQRYGFADSLILEETAAGLLLRKQKDEKLSWADTCKAMAEEGEDWSDFDSVISDGLEENG
ncbi:AbrB/MazE/SpoVT family DNA-binding domain-containing protein [Candidatus Electronema sp. PJ]|uniref:AbrB/MazE/SpoVT family DNA-binding domain-containing protein n=1 Tax=Candidatus Electronema sp. PJ TaxID=3401572 RepID=UPI003AA9424D